MTSHKDSLGVGPFTSKLEWYFQQDNAGEVETLEGWKMGCKKGCLWGR